MAQTIVRQKIIGNPGRRRPAARKRKRNPGDILGFVMSPAGNPGRKKGGSSMAAAKRRNRGKARANSSHKRRRRNPGTRMATRRNSSHRRRHTRENPGMRMNRHHRRHRRNPGAFAGGIGESITNAVFVIVGALGSKLGAQTVLGANNVGVTGYAANAAAGAVMWFLAEKVMKNRAAGNGIIAGTLVQIILRVINDYTPFGSYVANLGMGDYQAQSFVTPQVLVSPYQSAAIQIPNGWGAPPPPPMAAAPGGKGMGGRASYGAPGGGSY